MCSRIFPHLAKMGKPADVFSDPAFHCTKTSMLDNHVHPLCGHPHNRKGWANSYTQLQPQGSGNTSHGGQHGELFAMPLQQEKTHLPAAMPWYTADPTDMTRVALPKPRMCGLVWGWPTR